MDSKPFTERRAPGPPGPRSRSSSRAASASAKRRRCRPISEIKPLTTEAAITSVAATVDSTTGHVPAKTTTTVALDFGCITIDEESQAVPVRHAGPGPLGLHVAGPPGTAHWAALVIVDTHGPWTTATGRSTTSRGGGLPFVVAVNMFDGSPGTQPRGHGRRRGPRGERRRPADHLRHPAEAVRCETRCWRCCTTRSSGPEPRRARGPERTSLHWSTDPARRPPCEPPQGRKAARISGL